MKRTPLKKGSRLRPGTAKKKGNLEMTNFLTRLWFNTPQGGRKCQSCGKKLLDPIRTYYFDHLLPKVKYPEYALDERNIFLCCLECHSLKESGFPTQKHQDAIEKAKERFGLS